LDTRTCTQGQFAHNVIVPSPLKRGNDVLLAIGSVNVELPKEDAPSPNRPSVVSYNLVVTKCLLKCNCCYHMMQDMVSLVLRMLHPVMT